MRANENTEQNSQVDSVVSETAQQKPAIVAVDRRPIVAAHDAAEFDAATAAASAGILLGLLLARR